MNNPEAAKGNIISIMVHHRHDLEKGHIKPDRITSIGAFGFDLSHFTHRTQFCIAASIMFIVFILFGYVQESIFRTEGFTFGLYITCVQYTLYTIFAYIQGVITKDTKPRAKWTEYFKIAMFQVTSVSLSNIATVYLNYPTKVLFKTSKIIPVMIIGRLFFGKHYLFIQWVATTLLLMGISLFSLADSVVFPNFTWKGIIYMCASLAAESMGHNVTESIMVKNNCTEREVIFFNGIFGSFFTFTALLVSGEFQVASAFCNENSTIYVRIFILSILGYVGGSYSLALTKSFGIFSTMTVATCRKLTTIVLSFMIFPKPFVFTYFYAGFLAFAGISLNIYVKNSQEVAELFNFLKYQLTKLRYNNKSTI